MTETDTGDALVRAFQQQRPAYEEFAERLTALLGDVLALADVKVHAIESRTKSVDSLREKLRRPGQQYTAVGDLTDLCGLRVIVYYTTDVGRVIEQLKKEFEVDDAASSDVADRLAVDQFGYRSVHYIVTLGGSRRRLPEWKRVSALRAEIQVRTVVQHAWAAISHALQYKRPDDPPAQLKRRLARLAGLLELADEEFNTLRILHEQSDKQAAAAVTAGDLNLPIDAVSMRHYLEKSPTVWQLLEQVGEHTASQQPEDPELVSIAVSRAKEQGLATIGEVDTIVRDSAAEPNLSNEFLSTVASGAATLVTSVLLQYAIDRLIGGGEKPS